MLISKNTNVAEKSIPLTRSSNDLVGNNTAQFMRVSIRGCAAGPTNGRNDNSMFSMEMEPEQPRADRRDINTWINEVLEAEMSVTEVNVNIASENTNAESGFETPLGSLNGLTAQLSVREMGSTGNARRADPSGASINDNDEHPVQECTLSNQKAAYCYNLPL